MRNLVYSLLWSMFFVETKGQLCKRNEIMPHNYTCDQEKHLFHLNREKIDKYFALYS